MTTECTICQEPVTDEIKMTCAASHSFCFKCILKDVETNGQLKPCPNCQTGLKYILVLNRSKNVNNSTEPFYTIKFFEECLPLLNKIALSGPDSEKSCLISEFTLLLYIKNKKQLKHVKQCITNGSDIDDIFDLIKWIRPQGRSSLSLPQSFSNILFNSGSGSGPIGPSGPIGSIGPNDVVNNQGSTRISGNATEIAEMGAELLTNFLANEIFPNVYSNNYSVSRRL